MRKVKYPADLLKFKLDFLNYIPDIAYKNASWTQLWDSLHVLQRFYPRLLNSILIADYSLLIDYYENYINHVEPLLTSDQINQLKSIFDYDACRASIAEFFMKYAVDMQLYVCHYCETAYINVYPQDDRVALRQINNASRDKLKYILNVSDKSTDIVIANRPYDNKTKFNNVWERFIPNGGHNKFDQTWTKRNHFDIDHALAKGRCPLVALSVMNFVPSCQVCNEKLKKSKVLGGYINPSPIEELSPTSPKYDFDSNVDIKLINVSPCKFDPAYAVANHQHYDLIFDSHHTVYENIVDIFRLEERYQIHKIEGLYWLQMKRKYPDSNIKMMSTTLGKPEYSIDRIKEDIFQTDYDRLRHPCFSKLKRDSLK